MTTVVLTLTTPKTITATQVQVNNTTPDLVNSVLRCNCTLLDANNKPVSNTVVVVPFATLESGWTGKVNDTVAKAVLALI